MVNHGRCIFLWECGLVGIHLRSVNERSACHLFTLTVCLLLKNTNKSESATYNCSLSQNRTLSYWNKTNNHLIHQLHSFIEKSEMPLKTFAKSLSHTFKPFPWNWFPLHAQTCSLIGLNSCPIFALVQVGLLLNTHTYSYTHMGTPTHVHFINITIKYLFKNNNNCNQYS